MVRGIDTFKEFFKGFEDNYVIIGGTACEIHEDLYAQVPRAFDAIMQDLPNADFIKSAGLGNVTSLQIIEQLKKSML